jgi:hypothetical protein
MRIHGLIAIVTLLAASPALAQYHQPTQQAYSPWSFSGSIGADVAGPSNWHRNGTSGTVNLNSLNNTLSGTGTVTIRAKDFGDIYENAPRATLEIRYAVTEMSEYFGAISFSQAESEQALVGCFQATAGTQCNVNINGKFSDLNQYGLEAGYRQWLGIGLLGDRVKPYFAGRVGAIYTEAVDLALSTGSTSLGTVRFSEDSWSAMIGADLGVSAAITQFAEIGAEVGVRYTTKLSGDDSQLGALGLDEINDTEGTVTIPVSVRMNVVF